MTKPAKFWLWLGITLVTLYVAWGLVSYFFLDVHRAGV
jgi:hypothetical protein